MRNRLCAVIGLLGLLAGGCIEFETSLCAGGITCPSGTVCYGETGCVPAGQLGSCQDKADGDYCSYAGVPVGFCSDGLCFPAGCGNGVIEADEECDEGDALAGDGCSDTCQAEVCGNGVVDLRQLGGSLIPEDCDDANLLSLDACSSSCAAPPGFWEERTPGPGESSQHAMAYDAGRQRVVLFGDQKTWEWDGAAWTNLTPRVPLALPRNGGTMVYDAARRQVVYVGGLDNILGASSETWAWNGSNWSNITPADPSKSLPPLTNSPYKIGMAFDSSRERIVVFAEGKTWEWDGASWIDLSPASSPPNGGPLAYDASRGRSVLVIPDRGEETWEWDGTMWSRVTHPVAWGPIAGPIAYSAARSRVVLLTDFSETWEWDGTSWSDVTPAGAEDSPSEVVDPIMTYDISRGRVVLFGGNFDPNFPVVNTWEWDGSKWHNATDPPPPRPASRELHSLSYDSARGEIVLFGGNTASGTVNDTWVWDGASWANRTPEGAAISPSPRHSQATAYAANSERLILFGGGDETTLVNGDTWTWDGSAWADVTPPVPSDSPDARVGAAMAYDAARDQVILFGGQASLPEPEGPFDLIYPLGDTWVWDDGIWTELSPPSSPSSRTRASMAYDARRQRVVLHGGQDIIDPFTEMTDGPTAVMGQYDTWEWDGATWTDVTPTGDSLFAPQVHALHAMAYDAALQRVILTGTTNVGGDTSDTWQWDGSEWTRVPPEALPVIPGARGRHALAYDAPRGRTLLFGGNSFASSDSLLDDTWLFSHRAVGPEACGSRLDADHDGLIGCGDADCWGFCTPRCPPGTGCDAAAPQCGDGVCNDHLESPRLCPADCGPSVPVCGDYICDAGESAAACPGDC